MALEKMTNREQVLVIIVVAIFVGGAYGLLRYFPKNEALTVLNNTLEANKITIKNPVFPDEPIEDIEDLEDKDAILNTQLANLKNDIQVEEKKLAPASESQDVLLKISEAARAANVKVIESVPYIVARVNDTTTVETKRKLSRREQRVLDKLAQKNGSAATNSLGGAQGVAPKEGELIYQLVNSFEDARPLQKLSVEGGFKDIQGFIKALSNMQYQVTIVKLDIDVKFQTPAQGIPQPLLAKMIIAI